MLLGCFAAVLTEKVLQILKKKKKNGAENSIVQIFL